MTLNNLKKLFEYKEIAILGFGREGMSTYRLIRRFFPYKSIAVFDCDEKIKLIPFLEADLNCTVFTGSSYLNSLNKYDLIIKSPGISYKELSDIEFKGTISSQTDIFLSCFSSQVIGITGTKGKSTTSSLLLHILKQTGYNVVFVGNIGVPPFNEVDNIKDDTLIVYEISSHQLESVSNSPHISVLLNIFQEHLDHYRNYGEYQKAKLNIVKYQSPNDYFIYNADNEIIMKHIGDYDVRSAFLPFSFINEHALGCFSDGKVLKIKLHNKQQYHYNLNFERKLLGQHNLMNIAVVIMICKIIGVDDSGIFKAIASFNGLPHRLEYLGCFNNKHFYNDSIATISEAAIEAIRTIKDIDTLLTGGFDRGIDYHEYAFFLSHTSIRNIVLVGDAGKRINDILMALNHDKVCFLYDNFDDAARKAIELTKEASICLMSPAAASYGMFKNFEERGRRFLEIIKQST